MRKLLALSVILASPALAQQPNGTINAPIYATGYISQVGGTNVTTTIKSQPNHPTNLNIYTTDVISSTWTIKLPNPAFEGQILSFNCGAAVNAISVISSDGSSIDSTLPVACSLNTGFTIQFDQRSNIWRNIGSNNTSTLQLPAFTGGDCTTTAGSVVISCAHLLGAANSWVSAGVTPTTFGQTTLFQNGSKTAWSIFGPSVPGGAVTPWANVRSVIDIEPGTTAQNYNAYDAYIWNNVAWNPATGTAGVGLETYCANAVINAACFGINPAFTDSYDGTTGHSVASTMVGGELDFSVYNAGSVVTGFSFELQGAVQPAGAVPLAVYRNNASTAQWSNGLFIDDGAIKSGGAGIVLGTAGSASGANLVSVPLIFKMSDTTGTKHYPSITAYPNGSSNSSLYMSDSLLANGISFVMQPTGDGPIISAAGSDTNISLGLNAKGAGVVAFGSTPYSTFAPIFTSLTGYVYCNGASACTAATTVPVGGIGGLGTGVATALGNAVNTSGGPLTYTAYQSYTPSLAFNGGTIGTGNTTAGAYVTQGPKTTAQIIVTFGSSGVSAAPSSINVGLPVTPISSGACMGLDGTSANTLSVLMTGGSDTLMVWTYNAGNPAENSHILNITCDYRTN